MTSNKESPDAFAAPREAEEESSTDESPPPVGTPARRTLALDSSGSGNSSLTGDSTTTTTSCQHTSRRVLPEDVLSENDSDDEDECGDFMGPSYMARCPPSNGLVIADVEEDEKEEGDGGDSDIEGEDGK